MQVFEVKQIKVFRIGIKSIFKEATKLCLLCTFFNQFGAILVLDEKKCFAKLFMTI